MTGLDSYGMGVHERYLGFEEKTKTFDEFAFQKHIGSLCSSDNVYIWKGVNYDVTNDTEELEAKLQHYMVSKNIDLEDIRDTLMTPYVNLRSEHLKNNENGIVLTPGTVLNYNSGYKDDKGKEIIWQIHITNNGVEAKYNGWTFARSYYSGIIYDEDVNYDYMDFDKEQLRATEDVRTQWEGEFAFVFMGRAGDITKHMDKIIRAANGQADIDILDYSDELCFADVMKTCGIDIDFSKEFSINGQGFKFNKSQIYNSYAMMEYTTPPRDCSALEFLSICHENVKNNTENSDISQMALGEWKKYAEQYQKECIENYIAGNKRINWLEFFEKIFEGYKNDDNLLGMDNCRKILEWLKN